MGFCNANKYWWPLLWEIHFLLCKLEKDQFAENHPRENTHWDANKENGEFRAAAAQVCEVQLKVVNMNMTWCSRRGRSRSRRGQALLQRDSDDSEETQVIYIKNTNTTITIIHNMENLQHHLDQKELLRPCLRGCRWSWRGCRWWPGTPSTPLWRNPLVATAGLLLWWRQEFLWWQKYWQHSLKAVIGSSVAFTAAVAVAIYYLCFESEEQVINIKNTNDHHHHHENPQNGQHHCSNQNQYSQSAPTLVYLCTIATLMMKYSDPAWEDADGDGEGEDVHQRLHWLCCGEAPQWLTRGEIIRCEWLFQMKFCAPVSTYVTRSVMMWPII